MSLFISEQGRKALIKVAQWLEAGAPHVDINGRVIENFDMNIAVCGTTCCIAGAVCQFEGLGNFDPQDPAILYNDGWRGEGAGNLATRYLGINEVDAELLFLPWVNPDFYDNDFLSDNAAPFSDKALAARVIRDYLETGIVDWEGNGLQMHGKD